MLEGSLVHGSVRRRVGVIATLALAAVGLVVAPINGRAAVAGPGPVAVYDSIGASVPGNIPSEAFQATQTAEFGDLVGLAGGPRGLQSATVELSSWGCGTSGTWNGGNCLTALGATFSHELTLNMYAVNNTGPLPAVGTLLATKTTTFAIPYRPSASASCTGADAGKWKDSAGICDNGYATPVTFTFTAPLPLLPNQVIWSVAFNTSGFGTTPLGYATPCATSPQGCGYDALNVGLSGAATPTAGTDIDSNGAFVSSTTPGQYCDGGSVTGTLRDDTNSTNSCWSGYRPMASLTTTAPSSSASSVVVNPEHMQGWTSVRESPTDALVPATFVVGPSTPPLGNGSAQFSLPNGTPNFPTTPVNQTDAFSYLNAAYAGTRLADIAELNYSTYQHQSGPQTVALSFDVKYHSTDTAYGGRLVFEPYNSFPVTPNVWQNWSALNGTWWASKTSAAGSGGLCDQGHPCTWTQVLANWPSAVIDNPASPGTGNLVLKTGSSWPSGTVVNVDALTIGINTGTALTEKTFDFDVSAPTAPLAVSAVAADAEADVSWSAPASDGGSPITGYTVTAAPGGATCTTTSLTCTVAGLTNGTAFTFTVKATNVAGDSPASTASAPVTPLSRSEAPVPTAATPVAVAPLRLLDTRSGAIPASGSTTTVHVTGLDGVPADAQAVFLNVTATAATARGFITVWAAGAPRPGTSNLNVDIANQTIPNMVVSPVGAGGDVSIFVQNSTHLVVDVTGYVPTGIGYTSLTPTRAIDTREGVRPADASTTTVKVTDVAGAPIGATSVILNVTATNTGGAGFITVYPAGADRPTTSNLNVDHVGETRANLVIVPIGPDGTVSLFTQTSADLVVDVFGFFSPEANYNSVQPAQRLLDSRIAPSTKPATDSTTMVRIAGVGPVPTDVKYVIINVTSDTPTAPGFITVYPGGTPRPLASNLNVDGPTTIAANLVFVPVGADGTVALYSQNGGHLIVDVLGWTR